MWWRLAYKPQFTNQKSLKGGRAALFRVRSTFSDNEGSKLLAELLCSCLLIVGKLYRLTEIEREDTENGLAIYLVSSGLKVYVTVKSNKDVNELINVVDLFELNVL